MKFKGTLKGFAQTTHDAKQKRIKKDLFEFENDTPEPDLISMLFCKLAIRDAFEACKLKQRVKMIHLKEVFDQDLEVWSRSPGLPWRDLGYTTNADIRDDLDAVNKIRKYWQLVKHGRTTVQPPDCCAYYVRAHAAEQPKAVWEYPATITFGEACFALPLIHAYTDGKHPIAYGFESANCGFVKFDKTLPKWLLEKAFYILAYNIDFVHYENFGVANAANNWRMFNYIKDYCINTIIRLPNGERWQKNCGIATGSYFTQLVGSICNYIILKWGDYSAGSIIVAELGPSGDIITKKRSQFNKEQFAELTETIGIQVKDSYIPIVPTI